MLHAQNMMEIHLFKYKYLVSPTILFQSIFVSIKIYYPVNTCCL